MKIKASQEKVKENDLFPTTKNKEEIKLEKSSLIMEIEQAKNQLTLVQDQIALRDEGYYRQQLLIVLERIAKSLEERHGLTHTQNSEEDDEDEDEDEEE